MTEPLKNSFYTLRSGLTIFPEHQKTIDQWLTQLVHQTPARFVMLTDVSGQLISARGDQGRTNLVALGSLIAGDLAASQEIARFLGEYQDYQLVLREGQTSHTLIIAAGLHLVLFAQIPSEVPLGWARMLIQEAARQLAELFEKIPQQMEPTEPEPTFDENLPDLFKNALDELWLE
ncbi:MAG: hypothetical protein U0401_04705 [Anaerolineae bacterium]